MNLTVLPADTYTVINKTIITELDKKIITMLYQPIIGYTAVSLYFTLLDDLGNNYTSIELQHHHLMNIMQLRLDSIIEAREKLEAVGLLKTYFKKENINTYVYMLYSPLSVNEFLNHPILNVVLYNNLGKKEYNLIVDYFKIPRVVLKDMDDITKSFNQVFSSVVGKFIENDDIVVKNNNNLIIENVIDFTLLQESIPKNMISDKCFNQETKLLINSLSYIYKLDELTMAGLIRNNINEKGLIDKTNLRKSARNYYQFENNGRLPSVVYKTQPEYLRSATGDTSKRAKLIYSFETTSPYDFLASKYKTGEPTSRDVRLIENLMIDMNLNPGVVNVLLAYVLHTNNQKLNRNYIETIAGQWKRLNIETVEEALAITDKEYKKNNKQETKKINNYKPNLKSEKLPEWFNKDIEEEEISEEEKQEMENLLRDMI